MRAVVVVALLLTAFSARADEPRFSIFIQPLSWLGTTVLLVEQEVPCKVECYEFYDASVVEVPLGMRFVDDEGRDWIFEVTPHRSLAVHEDSDRSGPPLVATRETLRMVLTAGRQWRVPSAPSFFLTTKAVFMAGQHVGRSNIGTGTRPPPIVGTAATGMAGAGVDLGVDGTFGHFYVSFVLGGAVGLGLIDQSAVYPSALFGTFKGTAPAAGVVRPVAELNANILRVGLSF